MAVQRLRRAGVISNWQDSPFDLRRRQLTLAETANEIVIPNEVATASGNVAQTSALVRSERERGAPTLSFVYESRVRRSGSG